MRRTAVLVWAGAVLVGAGAALIVGCTGQQAGYSFATAAGGTVALQEGAGDAKAKSGGQSSELSGTQLWDQNCARCHNARSPSDYSDAQWDVAVTHMRIQARLTGEEERKIIQFLQASN